MRIPSYLVLARADLQLTPRPLDLIASAGQGGPPAYSQALGPPS